MEDMLMERLGIRAEQEDRRLIELGEKLNVPISKEAMYLFELARRMHVFLRDHVEVVEWTAAKAAELYTIGQNETFFKELFNDWFRVTQRDFIADALRVRKRA
jgi:hypothetical protein